MTSISTPFGGTPFDTFPRQSGEGNMGIRQIDLLQGTLDLLILKSLSTGANHGYGIATRIHQLSDDVLKVEEGSLYPALYRMEEQGLIDSEWSVTENNRKAKFYKLTRKGRTAAQAEVDGWLRLSSAVTKVLKAIEQGV
jgi:PadR family transcriptional regulator, regulatory protein PadR